MGKKRILVIDDDMTILRILEAKMGEAGYEVVCVNSPLEGLIIARREQPDIIILDIIMPEMNGYDVLKCLKEDPSTQNIPVMMLTIRSMETDVQKGLEMGADDYITKPLQTALLLKRMERLL
ncbi:MAG: response regulator [Candidatus Omnitrophota bacterium]